MVRAPSIRLATLAACAMAGGCVIPTPGADMARSRDSLDEDDVAFVQPGVTTRRDVLRALGEPSFAARDESAMCWCWVRLHAVVVFASPGGGGGGFPISDHESLVVTFHADGTVRALAFRDPAMDDLLAPIGEDAP